MTSLIDAIDNKINKLCSQRDVNPQVLKVFMHRFNQAEKEVLKQYLKQKLQLQKHFYRVQNE